MKVAFLGDISLNGRYIDYRKKKENPFLNLIPVLQDSDHVIGNLESFVKGDFGENQLKAPRLTTDLQTLDYLKDIRLSVACLANNHAFDHLEDGFYKTLDYLKRSDIECLGAGSSNQEASEPVIIEKNGVRVGLLNFVTHDTNPNIPETAKIHVNFFNLEKVITELSELKRIVDHVVLQLHWGGRLEGGLYPDYDQPSIAKKLIDHGADIIVGHHSHTFQPYERYKGKYIFYSLGNFCFSDFWFNEKYHPLPKRSTITGIVFIDFTKADFSVEVKFFKNNRNSFEKISKEAFVQTQNLIFNYFLRHQPLWNLYYLKHKFLRPLIFFLGRKDVPVSEKVSRIWRSFSRKYLSS
ncbi:MAG: poly-gamma-glutamate capsule biosynthesis protein CapA/YwtB (metallophosphatase superfamily) [Parvicella sp.]|jgi:poly-gamma-glutamate capsule biosynthesis protein CapA/YwtB (metallophosphatase superfamily)